MAGNDCSTVGDHGVNRRDCLGAATIGKGTKKKFEHLRPLCLRGKDNDGADTFGAEPVTWRKNSPPGFGKSRI